MCQVLSIFSSLSISWPSFISKIYTYLSLFNFDISITAPECSFSFSWQKKWYLEECIPLMVAGCLLLVHLAKIGHKLIIKKKKSEFDLSCTCWTEWVSSGSRRRMNKRGDRWAIIAQAQV